MSVIIFSFVSFIISVYRLNEWICFWWMSNQSIVISYSGIVIFFILVDSYSRRQRVDWHWNDVSAWFWVSFDRRQKAGNAIDSKWLYMKVPSSQELSRFLKLFGHHHSLAAQPKKLRYNSSLVVFGKLKECFAFSFCFFFWWKWPHIVSYQRNKNNYQKPLKMSFQLNEIVNSTMFCRWSVYRRWSWEVFTIENFGLLLYGERS